MMMQEITAQAREAVSELLEKAKLNEGDLFVVGCSSSEVGGKKIGSDSSVELAQAVYEGIAPLLHGKGIWLAAQCCEHLNRALIIEAECAKQYHLPRVNVRPQPKAGGSFATTAYERMQAPIAVESLCAQAKAGIDIGGTLIGMHLAPVAVPVRLSLDHIGCAAILCARSRAKYIGGPRAFYEESLL